MSRNWMDKAACTEVAPDLFFADATNLVDTKLAKKVCGECRVKDECLQYALVNRMDYGVWGGLAVQERRSLLRKSKVPRKK
jgi:WhiB family redox-sensing transcriptional regulator